MGMSPDLEREERWHGRRREVEVPQPEARAPEGSCRSSWWRPLPDEIRNAAPAPAAAICRPGDSGD